MFIYLGNSHEATVKGHYPKHVTCVECETQYVYYLEREATGQGFSLLGLFGNSASDKAEQRAAKNLQKRFEREIDVVPCLECGHIGPEMVRESRRLRLGWLSWTGLFLVVATVMLLPLYLSTRNNYADRDFNRVMLVIVALTGLGGVGCYAGRALSNQQHDPNQMKQAKRIKWGRSRAVTLEEFEAMEAEAEAEAEVEEEEEVKPKPRKKARRAE